MAANSIVTQGYIKVEDGSEYSQMYPTDISVYNGDYETQIGPGEIKVKSHGGDDYIRLYPYNGRLSIRSDGPADIALINRDEDDRNWIIAGPDYDGNLTFSYHLSY